MTVVHLLFAFFALANAVPVEANADLDQPPPAAIASPAPLADWQQVIYAELADSPEYAAQMDSAISAASAETGIAPEVLWSVAFTETHGRHWNAAGAVKRGSAGEIGLMQVKPFWAKAIQREYGVSLDLYNLADNVRAGAYILSRGGANINRMLSYYNTGQQLSSSAYQRRVVRYLNSIDDLAADAEASGLGLPSDVEQAFLPILPTLAAAGPSHDVQPADAVMAAAQAALAAQTTATAEAPKQFAQVGPQPVAPQTVAAAALLPAPRTADRKLNSRSHSHYDPNQDVSWAN